MRHWEATTQLCRHGPVWWSLGKHFDFSGIFLFIFFLYLGHSLTIVTCLFSQDRRYACQVCGKTYTDRHNRRRRHPEMRHVSPLSREMEALMRDIDSMPDIPAPQPVDLLQSIIGGATSGNNGDSAVTSGATYATCYPACHAINLNRCNPLRDPCQI